MTPTEYADKLRLQLADLRERNVPLLFAVTSTTSEMASRIFVRGEDSSGVKMGQYSTKPLYLSPSIIETLPNVKSTLKGKTGKNKFKSGKSHKTTYFEGWKGVRDSAGRPTDNKNLSFTGDMQSDFTNNQTKYATSATPERITANEYVVGWSNQENADKARGNEKQLGRDVFRLSDFEKRTFFEVLEFELKRFFNDTSGRSL